MANRVGFWVFPGDFEDAFFALSMVLIPLPYSKPGPHLKRNSLRNTEQRPIGIGELVSGPIAVMKGCRIDCFRRLSVKASLRLQPTLVRNYVPLDKLSTDPVPHLVIIRVGDSVHLDEGPPVVGVGDLAWRQIVQGAESHALHALRAVYQRKARS